MKKIVISSLLLFALCGCNQQNVTETVSEITLTPAEVKKITISDTNTAAVLNKYEGCAYDFDLDGVEDEVFLSTDAKKDEDGEYMWDDSHEWKLTVSTDKGKYILYDEYIHGNPELSLREYYNEDGSTYPILHLTISTGSSFEIREYKYDNGVFNESTIYNSGYINEISIEKY